MGRNSAKYQYYAAFAVNVSGMIYGIVCGWPSPTLPILQSNETPIPSGPMSSESLSWVVAIMCLGGFAGTILFGYIVDIVGRRMALWLLTVPHLLCFLFIILAQNEYYLLVSRFMGGLAGGGTFILIPLYIAEISEDRIRGSLSSKLVFSGNIGFLIAFTVGNYFTYTTAAIIYICLPVVYFVAVFRLPETPYYLIKRNKIAEAEQSLAYFRNVRQDIESDNEGYKMELENLKKQNGGNIKVVQESIKITYRDFINPTALKAMAISIGLLALNQGCGCFPMMNYTATIFREAGSNLTPNMSAIIVAIIQLIGSYISTILVDRSGRKFCLGISSFGTCIGLLTMAGFQHLKINGHDLSDFSWIMVASFSFTIFIASWGVLTLPFVVLSEIMPEKIRSTAVSLAMTLLWLMSFMVLKYFYKLFEVFGIHGCAYIFATISLLGTIFIIVFVPETKGKSFEEIQKLL